MAIEFQPDLTEWIASGSTAALLLTAQQQLSARCVEEVLKKIDHDVDASVMTPERALGYVAELAAFRRIVYRQQQQIDVGEAARRFAAEEARR